MTDKLMNTALHHAAKNGNEELAKLLIDNGAPINKADIYGSTPLHYAVQGGHNDVVLTLLHSGAVVNTADKSLQTPLHYAVKRGHKDVVLAFATFWCYCGRCGQEVAHPLIFCHTGSHLPQRRLLIRSLKQKRASSTGIMPGGLL